MALPGRAQFAGFAGVEDNQRNAEEWVLANCDNVPDDFFQT